MHRKRNTYYLRGIIVITLVIFLFLQLHAFNFRKYLNIYSITITILRMYCVFFKQILLADSRDPLLTEPTNDSVDAILSMVPSVLHKFLTPKTRNQTLAASCKFLFIICSFTRSLT